MPVFALLSLLITAAALFALLNHRVLRLPSTIGIMLLALGLSAALIGAGHAMPSIRDWAADVTGRIDFNQIVLHGMLAFLLFAGALQLDMRALAREWLPIAALAAGATMLSTAAVAGLSFLAFRVIGLDVPWLGCLLFGALISPTDPIAVLAIMRRVGAPPVLVTQLAGESLINDGIGAVLFLTLLAASRSGSMPALHDVLRLLIVQAGGGALLGVVAGYAVSSMLHLVDDYQVEVLLTLALAMGGYALADAFHVSGPLEAVAAGMMISAWGRPSAMSRSTREYVDKFWELIDEILNAVLFLLLGLEVLLIPYDPRFVLAGIVAVVVVLLARLSSVGAVIGLVRIVRSQMRGSVRVLTWGGLRGGLSVALALSLPDTRYRNLLLAATYIVVVFSIVGQGLTVRGFIVSLKLKLRNAEAEELAFVREPGRRRF
ncbi:MAG TPA: sodium:proton antiporter [Acidisarcina sp.]